MSEYVEVVIDSIRVSLMSQQRIVILREVGAERYLPIWIGPYEAEAITIALQEVEVSRPLTHDLLYNVFQSLSGVLVRVEVTSLESEVYYGNIVVDVNGKTMDVDTRPSDALALAVRAHVPIMIATSVMDSAGIIPEDNLEDSLDDKLEGESPEENEEVELEEGAEERLSVFQDFFENLEIPPGDEEDEE